MMDGMERVSGEDRALGNLIAAALDYEREWMAYANPAVYNKAGLSVEELVINKAAYHQQLLQATRAYREVAP